MIITRPVLGILLTLISILFGIATGLIVKFIGDRVPLVTLLMYRFLFSMPLLLLCDVMVRGRDFLQINARKTLLLRILIGLVGITCWFTSVRLLPLGQATALLQSSVIFITILSPLLLNESVGVYRWSAVIIGMTGILLLTDPFGDAFSVNVVFGISGALAGAALSVLLRMLGKVDHPFSVAVWYNGVGAVALTTLAFILPGVSMRIEGDVLFYVLLLGVMGGGLQICITSAFRYSEAVVISTMRYIHIPGAAFAAFLIFGEVMSRVELAGAAVVVLSCLFIGWREFVRARVPATPQPESGN